ncbi:MAG: hypothetical protein R2839_03355 [Thermomicrobiales bacterium]
MSPAIPSMDAAKGSSALPVHAASIVTTSALPASPMMNVALDLAMRIQAHAALMAALHVTLMKIVVGY